LPKPPLKKDFRQLDKLQFFAEPDLSLLLVLLFSEAPNGLRYLRWGGDGEAVQLEK
jgi:hypothetical protein